MKMTQNLNPSQEKKYFSNSSMLWNGLVKAKILILLKTYGIT